MFLYGAQYFRPPNPARADHRVHLTKIRKELKFNLIKLWAMWNYCHIKEDKYDFSELEEIMNICDELELKVIINTILENSPYWLERKYPEARYTDAKGMNIILGGNSNTQSGGHPGLCLDNDVIKKAAKNYLTNLAKMTREHISLIGYDCWNEPYLEPARCNNFWPDGSDRLFCYCQTSINKFRKWLEEKYKTVDNLNKAWIRKFNTWEDVFPPVRHGTYADWIDWRRFWMFNLGEIMKFRYETLKKVDTKHFIMSHAGSVAPLESESVSIGAVNNWFLAEQVEKWGCSAFPKWFNYSPGIYAGRLDLTRSAAKEKDFWISELQGGHGKYTGIKQSPQVRPQDIRLWNWLGIAYGAKAIMYWCYLIEVTSMESGGYGLIKRNGDITPRADEASKMCELLQQYEPIYKTYLPEPEVAILYDTDNSILAYAMDGNEDVINYSYTGYYNAIWESDLYARFVTPAQLNELKQKILIVPMYLILTEVTAKNIKNFVESGGTLITETHFGAYDKNGMLQSVIPSFGLSEVAGIEEEESFYTTPGNKPVNFNPMDDTYTEKIYCSPKIRFKSPVAVDVQAMNYITPLVLRGAKPIASYQNMCMVTHHRFGKGEVYYFGTNIGLSIYYGDKNAKEIVRKILLTKVQPKVRGIYLRPRLINNNKEALLVVINDGLVERKEDINIPDRFDEAKDILNNIIVKITNRKINLTVAPEDAVVVLLS